MNPYLFSLLLGGAGLGAMALSGMARGGHGHAGHGGHGHAGHAGGHGHASGARALPKDGPWGLPSPGGTLVSLLSFRVLFSLAIGFGTAGLLLERLLPAPLVIVGAAAGAIAFERLLVAPIWRLAFRFESQPAFTLESCVEGEATAVTGFDAQGQGLISIELDGQVVQVLGTLQTTDRELGVRVRPGMRLRVEDVNTARNSCTVSLL